MAYEDTMRRMVAWHAHQRPRQTVKEQALPPCMIVVISYMMKTMLMACALIADTWIGAIVSKFYQVDFLRRQGRLREI